MLTTSVEPFDVRAQLRARRLFALRQALIAAPQHIDVRNRSAGEVEAALDSATMDNWAALVIQQVRSGGPMDLDLTESGVRWVKSGGNPVLPAGAPTVGFSSSGVPILGGSAWTRRILGDEFAFEIAPPDEAAAAYDQAVATLAAVLPSRTARVRSCVTAALGLDGPVATVCGCSSEDWPGLVAFGIRCAPLLLAEEVLHEVTHTAVTSCLAGDGGRWLRQMPALLSPFTDTIRPAERVAQGILAYREVALLWRESLAFLAEDPTLVGLHSPDAAVTVAERRLAAVRGRVDRAERELLALMRGDDRVAWINLCGRILDQLPGSDGAVNSGGQRDAAVFARAGLNDIEQAEVILALEGRKVSRVGVPLAVGGAFRHAVGERGGLAFGCTAIIAMPDPLLGGFSNEAAHEVPLTDPEAAKGTVYAYVASEALAARECFELDAQDQAGQLLGIPACCRAWYAATWESARRVRAGDLASQLAALAHGSGHRLLAPPWQANAFAMYFGGGLCWHFPCSFECEATVAIVEDRRLHLAKSSPELCRRLTEIQRRPVLWTERHGVALTPTDQTLGDGDWLAGPPGLGHKLLDFSIDELELPRRQADLQALIGPWLLLRWRT